MPKKICMKGTSPGRAQFKSGHMIRGCWPRIASYTYCFMQLSQIGLNHLWAESYSIYYQNKEQVELSGCCYRSIDFTAIDSENAELGAQRHHLQGRKLIYNILVADYLSSKKSGGLQVTHTTRSRVQSSYPSSWLWRGPYLLWLSDRAS